MNQKKEIIKRALDTSNASISTATESVAVNPNIWDYKLRDYEEKKLIFTPLATQFDFRGAGVDYKVTIDEAPSAAAALVETTNVSISAISSRNVTFTPTEYGAAYQVTRKQMVRSFFNTMENMVKKLGYSMALKKDALAVSTVQTGAGNSVIVNSVSATTDLASTDTLNYAAITKAIKLIEEDVYTPSKLLINYAQKQQLLDISTIHKANEFGTRDAIANGLVGELFGLEIYVSHSIPTTSNVAKAVVLGESQTGEQAFGYAIKRDPIIENEYHALGRYWDIVGHEEYDFQVLHPNAICTIATYA
jgi:HK97 family phage major capsid protein